jgi:hypothetical protein
MLSAALVVTVLAVGTRAQSPTSPTSDDAIPTLPAPPSPKAHKPSEQGEPKPKPKPSSKEDTERAGELAAESTKAFMAGDVAKAEGLLLEQLKIQPKNFVVYYNLACCRAMQKDPKGGCDYLTKAIENGFCDLRQLEHDPTLDALRGEQRFRDILNNWPAILEARRDANVKGTEELFKKGYTNSKDERLKLSYRSAFDENSSRIAKEEMVRLAEWGDECVIPGLLDKGQMERDAWVVVVLPNRQDFMKWVVSMYGPDAVGSTSMIAGAYEHDQKRLVSMDLGATLRHEFFHVLHWRDMTRRGQMHPIWIMEGLCSLVEDYDFDKEGHLHPTVSWRSNIVKRLEKLGQLAPIEEIAKLSPFQFSGSRPLAKYAQARTIFLYLSDQGKLKDWYVEYTGAYREDPTGVKAIEKVLGKPIKDVNKDYRAWVRKIDMVPEEIKPGMASLGVEIDAGNGEGPVVLGIDRRGSDRPDLKMNDIITSIDHRATRDVAELVRVLSGYKPGDTVEVGYRRGKIYGTTSVTLVAR